MPPRRCSWSTASRRRSLRAITAAADVNLAAVNYHFGSKEELFQAVLTRRLDPMNQERVDLLTALEQARRPVPVACEQILSAMFIPALHLARDPARGGTNFLRLLGRAYADPAPFIRQFLSEQYARDDRAASRRRSVARCRELPKRELSWRLHFIMGALSYTLAGTDVLKLIAELTPAEAPRRRNAAAPAGAVPAGRTAVAADRLRRRRLALRRRPRLAR